MSIGSEGGRRGERAAARHLRRRGWTVVATRWRGAGGEIDLVAARGGVVALCEVKARSDPAALAEPVTAAQRVRIRRAAEAFVASRPDLAAPRPASTSSRCAWVGPGAGAPSARRGGRPVTCPAPPITSGVGHRLEGAPVQGREPPGPQGGVVLGRRVADVVGEAELGIRLRHRAGHQAVPGGLRDDRRGRDGGARGRPRSPGGAGGRRGRGGSRPRGRRPGTGRRRRAPAPSAAGWSCGARRGRSWPGRRSAPRPARRGASWRSRRGRARRAPTAWSRRGRPARGGRRGSATPGRGRPPRRPAGPPGTRGRPRRCRRRGGRRSAGRARRGGRPGADAARAGRRVPMRLAARARSAASRGCGPSCPPCRAGSTAWRG